MHNGSVISAEIPAEFKHEGRGESENSLDGINEEHKQKAAAVFLPQHYQEFYHEAFQLK